jgi:predicted  nucleic acid-binding Zn-ribbon protein
MEKLIERMGASEDFGPEYLSFICQYSEQVKQKESKFNESVSKLQREVSSKNHEIEQLHDQLYNAQLSLGKFQSLEQALKDEKDKYNMFVASVTPKLGESQQVPKLILIQIKQPFLAPRNQ